MLTTMDYRNIAVSPKEKPARSGISLPAISEAGWFLLSLALFMILGPFAGPIAIIAVMTCQKSEDREALPEPDAIESI